MFGLDDEIHKSRNKLTESFQNVNVIMMSWKDSHSLNHRP